MSPPGERAPAGQVFKPEVPVGTAPANLDDVSARETLLGLTRYAPALGTSGLPIHLLSHYLEASGIPFLLRNDAMLPILNASNIFRTTQDDKLPVKLLQAIREDFYRKTGSNGPTKGTISTTGTTSWIQASTSPSKDGDIAFNSLGDFTVKANYSLTYSIDRDGNITARGKITCYLQDYYDFHRNGKPTPIPIKIVEQLPKSYQKTYTPRDGSPALTDNAFAHLQSVYWKSKDSPRILMANPMDVLGVTQLDCELKSDPNGMSFKVKQH